MTAARPRVRFAPSPTGDLHVGNARTALFNWLFARRFGGDFILRIEDTDQLRTTKSFESRLREDLEWLSIDWNEGPGKEGKYGPYYQSERLGIYQGFLEKLVHMDCVYPCYCTEGELEAERAELIFRKMMPRYMGRCRNLSVEARKTLEAEGRQPSYRFRVGTGRITFRDLIRGAMKFDAEAMGDFIIVRSNGIPAYNFAVVIDDHLMQISHVIRGEDHLSNTALQMLIYRALGFMPPAFAHHSLILGKDRSKLSKRHGSVAVREFREKGILPEALVNYLSLLGSSPGAGREVCSLEDSIAAFSLDRAGKSGAIFDEEKLKWINGIYIRQRDLHRLTGELLPYIRGAGYDVDKLDFSWLKCVIDAIRSDLVTLSDVGDRIAIFFDEKFALSKDARQVLKDENARAVVHQLREALERTGTQGEGLYQEVTALIRAKTGLQGRKLFMPIRAALTGQMQGPELDKVFSLLSRASLLFRIEEAISDRHPVEH
jgi:nondiscriminating glutamyl-tRNA synthetase